MGWRFVLFEAVFINSNARKPINLQLMGWIASTLVFKIHPDGIRICFANRTYKTPYKKIFFTKIVTFCKLLDI